MKFIYLFIISVLALSLISGGSQYVFNRLSGGGIYEEQIYNQLISISEAKAKRVSIFLNEKILDAKFLATTKETREIFDEEINANIENMRTKIKKLAIVTGDEVKKYLEDYPNKTWEELNDDKDFRELAIRMFGSEGYTIIVDAKTATMALHKYPSFEGHDFFSAENIQNYPEQYKLIYRGIYGKRDAEGFYEWMEPTGEIRSKYAYGAYYEVGDKKYILVANTYLEEQGETAFMAKNISRELRNFQELKEYSDLIFINAEGDVIWSAEYNNELGTNILTGIYNESSLSVIFRKVKDNLNVEISDSEMYEVTGNLNIFVVSPIMEINNFTREEEFMGALALQINNYKIENLIAGYTGLGEKGEVYIVNNEGRYITPIKYNDSELDLISSRRIDNCFVDHKDSQSLRKDIDFFVRADSGKNYVKENTLGAYVYIPLSNWCVISEISEEEFSKALPSPNKLLIIGVSLSFTLLLIATLILHSFFRFKEVDSE